MKQLLFASLLLVPAGALAGENAYLSAARSIGDYYAASARKDGDAWTWAQYEGPGPGAHGEALHYPVSFYSGIAGPLYFLLNLHRATGDKKYLDAARGAGLRLVKTAKPLPGEG